MTSFTIRPLTLTDWDNWLPLWKGYLEFYESELKEDVAKLSFEKLADPAYAARYAFVGEQDGVLIGVVHCIIHDHNWHAADVCYLQDLYVSPQARGLGLGRALIEHVYADADTRGCAAVYWTTQEHNHGARKLYDQVAKLTPFIKYLR